MLYFEASGASGIVQEQLEPKNTGPDFLSPAHHPLHQKKPLLVFSEFTKQTAVVLFVPKLVSSTFFRYMLKKHFLEHLAPPNTPKIFLWCERLVLTTPGNAWRRLEVVGTPPNHPKFTKFSQIFMFGHDLDHQAGPEGPCQ